MRKQQQRRSGRKQRNAIQFLKDILERLAKFELEDTPNYQDFTLNLRGEIEKFLEKTNGKENSIGGDGGNEPPDGSVG